MRVGCKRAAGFYLHIAESVREVGEAINVLWETYTNTLAHTVSLSGLVRTPTDIMLLLGPETNP